MVTNGWPYDGDPTYCVFIKRQVDALRAHGVSADVLFIHGYRTPFAYFAGALFLLKESIRRKSYAVVHAHGGEAALAARFYVRAPLVASYLGDDILGRPSANGAVTWSGRLKSAVIRAHSRLAAATITKSAEMSRCLPTSTQRRNSILPNGVDAAAFKPVPQREARNALGWTTDEPTALFVANLRSSAQRARKRLWLVESAFEHVRSVLPEARLIVASDVPPDQMPMYMNAADCLVLASSVEGSPNVVKEALMCNLPVVATRVGDVEWVLDGIEPSYLVEPSQTSIGEALVACLTARARSNGRDKESVLGATVATERLLDIYQRTAPMFREDLLNHAVGSHAS